MQSMCGRAVLLITSFIELKTAVNEAVQSMLEGWFEKNEWSVGFCTEIKYDTAMKCLT